jgi:hypothetical protein
LRLPVLHTRLARSAAPSIALRWHVLHTQNCCRISHGHLATEPCRATDGREALAILDAPKWGRVGCLPIALWHALAISVALDWARLASTPAARFLCRVGGTIAVRRNATLRHKPEGTVTQALPARGRSAEARPGPAALRRNRATQLGVQCCIASRAQNAMMHTNRSQRLGRPGRACRRGSPRCQRGWRECRGRSAGFSFPPRKKNPEWPRSSARRRRPGPARTLLLAPAAPVIFRLGPVAPWLLPVPRSTQELIEQALPTPPARQGSTEATRPSHLLRRFFAKSALPQYRSQILESNPTDIR